MTEPQAWELGGVEYPIGPDDLTLKERFDVELEKLGNTYPLLPGDVLTRDADGTYTKHAPGLAVCQLVIPDELVIRWADYEPEAL